MPAKRKRAASRKGSAGEAHVQKAYEAKGYRVFRARPSKIPIWKYGRIAMWFTHSNDIFGVFDGEAVRSDQPHEYWQACQPSGVRMRRRKIEAELIPYWNLDLLDKAYVVRIWELRLGKFRIHTWHGDRLWSVEVVETSSSS